MRKQFVRIYIVAGPKSTSTTQDFVTAYTQVSDCSQMFWDIRNEVESRFKQLYDSGITRMADIADIKVTIPRRCSRQNQRNVSTSLQRNQKIIGTELELFLFHTWII